MSYLNKRILFYGLNVDCLLVDLTLFKFGSDFPKYLFLFEALRLNDNRLYDIPVNFQSCNFQMFRTFGRCVFLCMQFLVWPEGWTSQRFQSC